MPSAKKRVPVVPAKVKAAVEHLFENPKADLAEAAKVAGLSTYALRSAMMRPHVSRYVWHEKRSRLELLCAQNPAALRDIRDSSENSMARVAAIKTAEQLRMEIQEATGGRHMQQQQPGLTIVIEGAHDAAPGDPNRIGASSCFSIVTRPPRPPLIEHDPAQDREREPVER